ncbi:hypothetical protein [Zoogloea sp. 1C4]|uniref:hypothetical protein n=1 Tax=Zoogloea sp. 1C4 TaxID=2570190 RepID=UPI001291FAB5|nr:hypothetical protein [Zoogloea sp. 1C4]
MSRKTVGQARLRAYAACAGIDDARLAGAARMGKLDGNGVVRKSGKLVSLCADKPKEPFGRFVYRYGKPGEVEIEHVASAAERAALTSRATGPRMGEDIFAFQRGPFTYYVVEATGMAQGISVMVFKSGKRIADLFSGNDAGTDFRSDMLEVNFQRPASPVFEKKAPKDAF